MEKSSKEEKVLQFCNSVFIFSNANDIMEKLYPLHIILHALFRKHWKNELFKKKKKKNSLGHPLEKIVFWKS